MFWGKEGRKRRRRAGVARPVATRETLLINRSVLPSSLRRHYFLLLMFHPAPLKQFLESEGLPSLDWAPLFVPVSFSIPWEHSHRLMGRFPQGGGGAICPPGGVARMPVEETSPCQVLHLLLYLFLFFYNFIYLSEREGKQKQGERQAEREASSLGS